MSAIIHLGDSIAGMAALADKSVDHTITDPPFEKEAHTKQRRVGKGAGVVNAPLDFAPLDEDLRTKAAFQIARVTRRWALVFCQIEAAHKWQAALEAAGSVYKRTCIWVKPDGQPQFTGDRPGMGYETFVLAGPPHAETDTAADDQDDITAIVSTHAAGRSKWNGGGTHGVFTFNKIGPDDLRTGHPTQKPYALMERLVRLFTNPGDLILDPFTGSGTTGVAAVRNGRHFVGWELDPKYHAIATKRIGRTHEQRELAL